MHFRPDMCDARSPADLEVVQLTADRKRPGTHVYMEAQVFTPDSKRLILHVGTDAHSTQNRTAGHQYLRCDLDDDGSLHPMTDEIGVTAPSVSPDGQYLYYFVDESQINGGRITLKRVNMDGAQRTTLAVIDTPLPALGVQPSRLYPLSTISSDGQRLAVGCFLGDGRREQADFGVLVFDLATTQAHVPLRGPTFCNTHPQYCRSTDPSHQRDLLIQENHGNEHDARGRITTVVAGRGADIHVVRDDGTHWRSMPWGRDVHERCQGHQCWRGMSTWAITGTAEPDAANLIESQAYPSDAHEGMHAEHASPRNILTAGHPNPRFHHFATDRGGDRLITDHVDRERTPTLHLAHLGRPGQDLIGDMQYLLDTRSSNVKAAHVHPFLSPDGTMGFFNSDETGTLQAYMVRGWA